MGNAPSELQCGPEESLFVESSPVNVDAARLVNTCLKKRVKYACRFCLTKYRDKELAKIHMKTCYSNPTPQQSVNKYRKSMEHHFLQTSGTRKSQKVIHSSRAKEFNPPNPSYQCGFCKKVFQCKAHLVTHERIHTGEKPYVCQLCGHGFAHKSNMVTHQKRCKGLKPKPRIWGPISANATATECEDPEMSIAVNIRPTVNAAHKFPARLSDYLSRAVTDEPQDQELHDTEAVATTNGKEAKELSLSGISTTIVETNKESTNRFKASLIQEGGKLAKACSFCGKIFNRPSDRLLHERLHYSAEPSRV